MVVFAYREFKDIVSVLHTSSRFPSTLDISRVSGSQVSGNLLDVGDGFPILSRVLVEYGHLLIINPSTGMDQKILPCGQGRIDSVKINPSLLRMRE